MNLLVISTAQSQHLVPVHDVIFCKMEKGISTFHLATDDIIETDQPFSFFEERLNPKQFYKPTDYLLININYIAKVLFKTPYIIVT